jgi:hypothetical protein
MAFDATTPYALACLGDPGRSRQSLEVLGREEPAAEREQDLVALATSWNVVMSEREAHDVVAEYDMIMATQPSSRRTLGAAMNSASPASASVS